ncbi:molybdopterin-binding protein [Labrys wisconsinensis]|uniref:DMSO/TMAO reductase YedYZ molybdopterin-dependent catalytic subunit n=1 Tax=Labrys wisconsinensis TaxID=425677 RepID=A0ABU0JPG4_9HYPH|nr:molybdopterin-binding protein [Labrys wisconsinensis]MDQ0475169.1 DMSO/TMAO reductase YedYZ molybdopterin-dependent catalytic subunit [Labrys wisconsinensis]
MSAILTRRRLLAGAALAAGGIGLAACDPFGQGAGVTDVLARAETLTIWAQRLLLSNGALAREFTEADLSPVFRSNGTAKPDSEDYARLLETKFADWRLTVDGLVARKLSLSLDDLKKLPARTQITRHDCVEGWSAIGKWTGVPLGLVLQAAGLAPQARYAVFHCADDLEQSLDGSGRYYESVDLIDAFHPQTILAYAMNGQPLPVDHGAPLRLRVERQLGYKQAKYVMRIEIVDSFAAIAGGKGGFWEDRGYEWYAGI